MRHRGERALGTVPFEQPQDAALPHGQRIPVPQDRAAHLRRQGLACVEPGPREARRHDAVRRGPRRRAPRQRRCRSRPAVGHTWERLTKTPRGSMATTRGKCWHAEGRWSWPSCRWIAQRRPRAGFEERAITAHAPCDDWLVGRTPVRRSRSTSRRRARAEGPTTRAPARGGDRAAPRPESPSPRCSRRRRGGSDSRREGEGRESSGSQVPGTVKNVKAQLKPRTTD